MIRYKKGILKDFSFNIEEKTVHVKNKKAKDKPYKKAKCYDIFTFDIEVSSMWMDKQLNIIQYSKNKPEEYWNSLTPVSLCYIWQFGINDTVYYGRYLEEFKDLLDELPEAESIIWVHNLAYEFHFLVNILKFDKVFAKLPHKPMKATPKDYPYIDFRCSYMLTNLSLDKWGKELGFEKEPPIDYMKIRTPESKLTRKELQYCERDCEVVYKGICDHLRTYKDIFDIPLTSTGKVRRPVKDLLFKDPNYPKFIKSLVPTPEHYILLRLLFAGGYTHVNRYYAGRLIEGLIEHYDFASSYPAVMCAFKFPMHKWTYRLDTYIPDDKTFENYAFIMKIKFKGLRSTTINTYLQRSKCKCSGAEYDNGRIISADECETVCTEMDWLIIKNHYEWDEIYLIDSWYSKKDYLPKPLIKYILKLYYNKTALKNVKGAEDEYMTSKQYINACYGMTVSAIIQSDVVYTESGDWYMTSITHEDLDSKLKSLSNKFKTRDKRYFLSYSWGCWVTAYARYNLWKCMDMCTHDDLMPGMDAIYMDTDSIIALGHHDFTSYDNWITGKLKKMCKHYDIDFELTRPKDPKGIPHPLGVFSKEDDCEQIKALHAKCYCVRDAKTHELQLTVAGINKDAVAMLKNDLDNFDDGFCFDKDDKSVKKNLHTYIKEQPDITIDGHTYSYRSGINMRPTSYTIKQSDEYERMLEWIQNFTIDDLTDMNLNIMKGIIDNEETILFT